MSSSKYDAAAAKLVEAIDIAVDAFKKYPPKDFEAHHLAHVINVYTRFKNDRLQAEQKYRNLASLKYDHEAVFTFFQEGSGPAVEYFWQQLRAANLDYKRENKMNKILKRGKINSDIEWDFVTDVIVPYRQEGMITDEQFASLQEMLGKFESRRNK